MCVKLSRFWSVVPLIPLLPKNSIHLLYCMVIFRKTCVCHCKWSRPLSGWTCGSCSPTWRQWMQSSGDSCHVLGSLGVWQMFLSSHLKFWLLWPTECSSSCFAALSLEHPQCSLCNRCLLSWEPKTIDLFYSKEESWRGSGSPHQDKCL